jgi:hypothetical protein
MSLPVPFPLAAAKARGDRARARRALASRATDFGALWSCASENVYEDLVEGGYASRRDVSETGARIAQASGLLCEVMYLVPDHERPGESIWLNHDGYTARELLDAFRTGGLVRMGNSPEPSPRLWHYTVNQTADQTSEVISR